LISILLENINNNDNIEFYLEKKIDFPFFKLLKKYYGSLLSNSHLKDRLQYTIFNKKTRLPIGILQINRGKNTFLQIALIPSITNKGLGKKIIEKAIQENNLKKIDWTASEYNYPSLKLLQKFGGGIFDGQENRKSKEGFFKPSKEILPSMKNNLANAVKEAKQKFKKSDYLNNNIKKEIDQYIKNYKRKIN